VKAEKPAAIKAKLQAVQEELELWDAHEKGERAYKRFKDAYAEAETEIAERDAAQKVVDRMKDIPDMYEKRRSLIKPEKVERPDQVYDLDALKAELDITAFKEENAELIEELPDYKPVEFDPAALNAVQERMFKLKARLDLHNSVKTRAQEIRTRLAELKDAMEKQQALELIIEGYSDKAMKKMAIESISKHLMASVNRYAALVFENYSFEFVWGTQIQILVHRPEGVSDVRKLSGAESMLFTLILILSLLVFVPKSKRLSLLILDEPYASFSDGTAELFTKLLPHITQVIPSVLIITPKSEFRVDGANEFTMMKQHGGTVLKKGHPDEI
jgi:DNA repair exonuclease SbcCD ATPase subunit